MRWAEITLTASEESADIVANILIEEGCGGVAITGPSVRASGRAELPAEDQTVLTAYLPVDDRLEARLQLTQDRIKLLPETGLDIGTGEITITPVEDADWASAWRSYFKPIEVGDVFVKPSWEHIEVKPGQVVVEIDPGMAFGTGNHPTTQLCLFALQRLIKGGERVLDAGTGSGILSIAAVKLGAREVTATEIDTIAIEAAVNNTNHNGVADRVSVLRADSLSGIRPGFDIAVANITADPIIGMASELARCVRPGGMILISGVIEARADEVAEKLAEAGFELIDKSMNDEWVAMTMRRVASCELSGPS